MDRGGRTEQKLGEFSPVLMCFPKVDEALESLRGCEGEEVRLQHIHELLLSFIQTTPEPCFLLGAVSHFISCVLKGKWVESYTFSRFEFWLNHSSGLSSEENYRVRAKIAGKYLPREAYQVLFPIGMGKKYFGSHYVTAHSSPDLDTTVSSFWGWLDAFSARVAEGMHLWNVPGGAPDQVEIRFLFQQLFGEEFFAHFAKTRTSLSVSAMDLVTSSGVVQKEGLASVERLDEDKASSAVVLVDEEGSYLGDWRQSDVEGVRKVTVLLNHCLRFFASQLQRRLTILLSYEKLTRKDLEEEIKRLFAEKILALEPVREFTEKQKRRVHDYLCKVLGVKEGGESSVHSFWETMQAIPLTPFTESLSALSQLMSTLFDEQGFLVESRPIIFRGLEGVVEAMEAAILSLRHYVDRLSVAFAIKKEVFGYPQQVISYRAEVEEMRMKMGSLSYLTVTMPSNGDREKAVGVVRSSDVFRSVLGTVSLRDFCNRDETKIPPYLEVISIIDHHKSALSTSTPPVAFIADAQSANALVAEMAFAMHDRYSLVGFTEKELLEQMERYAGCKQNKEGRILQRLLQKHAISRDSKGFFLDPMREYVEYLHYLYAILDDTDLLSKVSYRDVHCVASLLNRLKSLQLNQEVEVLSFDDLPHDATFAAKAAKRILQNEEMYSLYKKIYSCKEETIEVALKACSTGEVSNLFADTKVQNGCCRVGQTKLFAKNFGSFYRAAADLRRLWQREALRCYEERNECDLHMHMISTVPGAEEVYQGSEGNYDHKDELWIWIPEQEEAIAHLKAFLSAFRVSPQLKGQTFELELPCEGGKVLDQIFHESFLPVTKRPSSCGEGSSIAILRYKAGLLNSRKAMISPHLPKLAS